MIRILNIICLISLTSLFSGCDGNYTNLKVTGIVSDEISENPVENAEVTINCWVYDTEIWESKAVKKTAITDSNGQFSLNFKKGEALDIVVKSDTFREYKQSITLKKSTNNFNIKLKKTD
jgi:hypothetical protein